MISIALFLPWSGGVTAWASSVFTSGYGGTATALPWLISMTLLLESATPRENHGHCCDIAEIELAREGSRGRADWQVYTS